MWMFAIGHCIVCKKFITFNPDFVPSLRDKNGEKQPVCRDCARRIDPNFQIQKNAYQPTNDEVEI